MSITRTQTPISTAVSGSNVVTLNVALTNNPAVGSLLVLGVAWGGGTTPTITVPAGWTAIATQRTSGTNFTSRMYYKISAGAGDKTVTVSVDSGNRPALSLQEYTFTGGTPTLDVADSVLDGSSSTSHPTPNVNPVDAAESLLVAMFVGPDGATTYTEAFSGPTTGSDNELCDLDSGGTGGNDCHLVMADRIDTNVQAGNYSCTGTSSSANIGANHIAIFRNVPPTTAYRDAATRFRLQITAWKDAATRFRLRITAWKDTATRFRLRVTAWKDTASRFRLRVDAYKDVATRFKLVIGLPGWKDAATRFRLRIAAYRDVATRFRLRVDAYRDAATRFRLGILRYADGATRFRLGILRYVDAAARLRLRVTGNADATVRFVVIGLVRQDGALRFSLRAPTMTLTGTYHGNPASQNLRFARPTESHPTYVPDDDSTRIGVH